jgi:site-specific recombinase XerD
MTISEAVEQYIVHKRLLGMKFGSAAVVLRAFARTAGNASPDAVNAEQVRNFLFSGATAAQTASQKWSTLRGFYRFAIARQLATVSPLPIRMPRASQRLAPYIYNDSEVLALIQGLGSLPLSKLQPHTLHVVLLLLYGAGLRIGEAVRLIMADVDLANRVLSIRLSKFYKDRQIPIGHDLVFALENYSSLRRCLGHSDANDVPFLVTDKGEPLSVQLVEQAFRRLCSVAQIRREDGGRYQPRLHDLRHSFAVHTLIAWYKKGADVNLMLPRLSTYLGHIKLSYTQLYLTMTPELLQQASERFENFVKPERFYGRSQ